jgi:hypothetical protein
MNTALRISIIIFSFLTIPINIIQSYQYKEYILHWIDMDKEKYWKVFLKTEDRFKGILWKKDYDLNQYVVEKELSLGDINVNKNVSQEIYAISSKNIPNFEKISVIQLLVDDQFSDKDESMILVQINNSKQNYYHHQRNLIHFQEKGFNKFQTGLFNFEFIPITNGQDNTIVIKVVTIKENKNLNNIRIKFLRKN